MELTTACEVWSELCDRGGVDKKYYDKDLEESLIEAFDLDKSLTLSDSLKVSSLSSTEFLVKLFKIASPFILMYKDILTTAVKIEAYQGHDNLQIIFELGVDEKLDMTLDAFKVHIETAITAIKPMDVDIWDYDRLWGLFSAVNSFTSNREKANDSHYPKLIQWTEQYNSGRWPDFILEPPISAVDELDQLFKRLMKICQMIIDRSMDFGNFLNDLKSGSLHAQNLEIHHDKIHMSEGLEGFLRMLHNDRWSISVAKSAYDCADLVSGDPSLAPQLIKKLTEILDNPAPEIRPVNVVVSELLQMLQLPIWKLRYELFSVWVFCRTSIAMEGVSKIEYHFTDGLFDLPFRAKILASLQGVEPPLHLWSEVRTTVVDPQGKSRKNSMQPDFSLTVDPESPPVSAVGIIECKQYKKSARKNFSDALSDYAKGQEDAKVILVNYGPALVTVLGKVPQKFQNRVILLGTLRPDNPQALIDYESWVIEVINKKCKRITTTPGAVNTTLPFVKGFLGARCQLTWKELPKDLDLYIQTPQWLGRQKIDYRNMGGIHESPWISLDKDVTSGKGPETIQVAKAVRGRYRVAVHCYSEDGSLSHSFASVTINIGKELTQIIECPTNGSGRWWYVCDIDFEANRIVPLNRVEDIDPFEES